MILLDTSAWIYYFKNSWPKRLNFDDIIICSPIIQEILQGIKDDEIYINIKESILNLPIISEPLSYDLFVKAAEIYRIGKKKGFTIRSSIDCLISAIAIKNNVPVMHCDRDFDNIEKFTTLRIQKFIQI